jgi:hypothetical protein
MGRLEKLVQAERKKLVSAALTSGDVDPEAFQRLDRLSRLATAAKPERRWVVPALAFVLLTVFTVLLVTEQRETEVELDLTVNELHFQIPWNEPVSGDQFLRSLNASGLKEIDVDGEVWSPAPGGVCSVRVELLEGAKKGEALTLPALLAPANWDVGISRSGAETSFEFLAPAKASRQSPDGDFAVRAALRGRAVLSSNCTPDGKFRNLTWSGPDALTMYMGAATTLRCQSALPVEFARQMEFRNLRLSGVQRVQGGAGPVDQRRSSIVSGTVYLDALNAKALPLRPFEDISFSSSSGYIRAISLAQDSGSQSDGLRLQAHAAVEGMKAGSGPNARSQMPGWLEVLAAQKGIALLWASGVYVFGIIYIVLRWFGIIG